MKHTVRSRTIRRALRRRGTATVEMALVLPTLIVLVFGGIEVGLLVRATLAVNHVANEVSRVAAIGGTPTEINSALATSSPGLNAQLFVPSYTWRAWDPDTQSWGAWMTLGPSGSENDAQAGSQIMVDLQYPHQLVFGRLFGVLFHAADDGTMALSASMVTIRE